MKDYLEMCMFYKNQQLPIGDVCETYHNQHGTIKIQV